MTAPVRSRRLILVAVCAASLAAISTLGFTWFGFFEKPSASWRFGPDQQAVESFARVPMFDAVTLEVTLPSKAWVYTVYFSQAQGCRAMFPSDYLATDHKNPLPAGTHRLPGRFKDKDLQWFVPNCKEQSVSYMTIVSTSPLQDLHKKMQTMFQIGNTAFPDMSFGSYMPKGGKEVLPKRSEIPHPLLQKAAYDVDAALLGPMLEVEGRSGVFVQVMHIIPADRRPDTKDPRSPVQRQLDQAEGKVRKRQKPGGGK